MEEQFQNTIKTTTLYHEEEQASIQTKPDSLNPKGEEIVPIDEEEEEEEEAHMYFQDIDSSCSTPFVSAPSSPGRGSPLAAGGGGGGGGFFYSAPASPMHFVLSSSMHSEPSVSTSYEFEFSARFGMSGTASGGGSMSSADELFLNGQIRPMKLSSHLQRPQALEPLLDLDESEVNDDDDDNDIGRGRDVKWRNKSLRRRTRSMSPLRTPAFQWYENTTTMKTTEIITKAEVVEDSEGGTLESKHDVDEEEVFGETNPSMSASSSRSSSASRSSKRWVFLKDFLYRSKSEGRNNGHKFWSSISFSPVVKDRKGSSTSVPSCEAATTCSSSSSSQDMKKKKKVVKQEEEEGGTGAGANKKKKKKGGDIPLTSRMKATNGGVGGGGGGGGGKRRIQILSPHEVHYKASRAQAEELRKKTFLPYRQGLLGCLGFSSKGYGAINGFARTLNPVSSR